MAPSRYVRIQEFQAHTPTVNCASIGRKSMGVVVTGGEDRAVHVRTIGTDSLRMELHGCSSAVDSVALDGEEQTVAAGTASGAIKIFNLDEARVSRSLSAHKCNVTCLDFNPSFLVSGSMDTRVKLWDMHSNREVCMFKDHTHPITRVRLSPDGKVVASGDAAGHIKIFDLVAGKLVQQYNHGGTITGLEFHPGEYALATSSMDKTVKLWDLCDTESRGPCVTTPAEATGVRGIAWHPSGKYMFAALQDGLRVWELEAPLGPNKFGPLQHDNVDVPWTKIHDLVVLRDKPRIVGCSFASSFVGMWVVELPQVKPFADSPQLLQPPVPEVRGSSGNIPAPANPAYPVVPAGGPALQYPPAPGIGTIPGVSSMQQQQQQPQRYGRVSSGAARSPTAGCWDPSPVGNNHAALGSRQSMGWGGTPAAAEAGGEPFLQPMQQPQQQPVPLGLANLNANIAREQERYRQAQQAAAAAGGMAAGAAAAARYSPAAYMDTSSSYSQGPVPAVYPAPLHQQHRAHSPVYPPLPQPAPLPEQAPMLQRFLNQGADAVDGAFSPLPAAVDTVQDANQPMGIVQHGARMPSPSPSPLHAGLGRQLPPTGGPNQPPVLQPQHVPPVSAELQPPLGVAAQPGRPRSRNSDGAGPVPVPMAAAPMGLPQPAVSVAVPAEPPRPAMVSVGIGVGDSLLRGMEPGALRLAAQQAAAVQTTLPAPAAPGPQPLAQWPAGNGSGGHTPPLPPAAAGKLPRVSGGAPAPSGSGRLGKAAGPAAGAAAAGKSDAERLGELLKLTEAAGRLVVERGQHLDKLKALLRRGDLRGMLVHARGGPDLVPAADVLGGLMKRRNFQDFLSLDLVPVLVPLLEGLLGAEADEHRMVGVDLGLLLLKTQGGLIRDVLHSPANRRGGTDLAFEARREKCDTACLALQGLRAKLATAMHVEPQREGGGSPTLLARMGELSEQLVLLEAPGV